jgi:DNA helicase-2/ATP-dependent DNA helicase PcrA
MSDRDEALGVAKEIAMESRRSKEKTYEDVAVLYRTNAQSRPIENELRKLGIPYRIYGGTSFYQRKEVKDAIAYFRLAINPKDNEALMRVINYPARGIGETTLRKISEHAILSQLSMLEVVQAPEETGLNVNAGTMKKLVSFGQMVTRFAEAADKMNAYDFAEMILRESGVRTAAMLDRTPEGIDRAENLEELLNGIHELVDRRVEEGVDFTPIHDFMAEVALLTDQDQNLKDETRRVTLMTVHAAKGLEFPIVYIVGM